MNEYSTRLIFLFNLYFSEQATSAETAELMTIIREGKHDRQLGELLEEAWKKQNRKDVFFTKQDSDNILNSILQSSFEENYDQVEDTEQPTRSYNL